MKPYSLMAIAIFAVCAFSTGCSTQSADKARTSGQTVPGNPVSGQAITQKPTPEQEAAKKSAMERGPAIAAANFAATHPQGQNRKK